MEKKMASKGKTTPQKKASPKKKKAGQNVQSDKKAKVTKKGAKVEATPANESKGAKGGAKPASALKGITAEQYNIIWATYTECQNIQECAKRAEVNYKTAKRYVDGEGDPKRGMIPCAVRYERVMAQSREDEDFTLQKWREETFRGTITKTMELLKGEAIIHQDVINRKLKLKKAKKPVAPDLPLDRLVGAMDKIYRMGEHALGGPDQTIGDASESRFRNWTKEELLHYWERGVRPEHDL
jgi:hypothetical protein